MHLDILQVFGVVLVFVLLLASLSIGVALMVARQKASTVISFSSGMLNDRMQNVRGVSANLVADLGLSELDAAQLTLGRKLPSHCFAKWP